MALGGGTFLTQNKVLPGSYINFISLAKASSNLGDRGYCAFPLELDFGIENEIFTVTSEDFQKRSFELFGYDYTHEKLKGLRDLFQNLKTLYAFRLNGNGVCASNDFGVMKYSGIRGNDFSLVISRNVDYEEMFDVKLMCDSSIIDSQTVSSSSELVNNYVNYKEDVELIETAGCPFVNGENGVVNGQSHQNFLDKVENYYFNILGTSSDDDIIKSLYVNYTKRMREEVGAKFQVVLHNYNADYEGVISVKNNITDDIFSESSLVYWVSGLEASCDVNKSCLNRVYNGEFLINAEYTQTELTNAINDGEFVIHKVGDDYRVLSDINTLVTISDTKGDIFKENQTIRVIDQIANDIATLFNTKYLGNVPNDKDGRISLWADIVKHHEQLQDIRAIEDFSEDDVTVEIGDTKKDVVVNDSISVVNAMAKLYMSVVIG